MFKKAGGMGMDSKIKDLRKIRKKNKRKKFFKRLRIVLLIVLLIFIAYISRGKWLPFFDGIVDRYKTTIVNDGKLADGNFPLEIDSSSDYSISKTDKSFAVLTDTYLLFYEKNGELITSHQHGMSNPILKNFGKKSLIYDLGAYKFSAYSKQKGTYSKTLKDKIAYGKISDKGYACIVTKSEKYASMMTIFDNEGKEIFYSSLKNKIIDVAFYNDSSGCVATTMSAEGGQIISKMLSFNFNKEQEEWQSQSILTLTLSSSVCSDNQISLVGNNQFNILSSNGEIKYTYKYKSDLVGYSCAEHLAALVFHNTERRKTNLMIISNENEPIDIAINGEFKYVMTTSNKIFIMTDKELFAYSHSGEKMATVSLTKDYSGFTIIEDYIYLLGDAIVDRIDFKS